MTPPSGPEAVRRGSALVGRVASSAGVSSLGAALWPFVAGRVVALCSLEAARLLVSDAGIDSLKALAASRAGLFSWDASWYLRIATSGYGHAGRAGLRFFPLLPALDKALSTIFGIGARTSMLLVTTFATLTALTLIHRLVVVETGDEALARRAVFLLALWPAAFVLVMGYAESVLITAAAATFLLIRNRRFAWAIIPAFAAGLCRPDGLLLALPVAIEAIRWRPSTAAGYLERLGAIAAAPAGAVAYLAWAASRASFFTPLSEQLSAHHRGTVADPLVTFAHDLAYAAHGHHLGTALHAPFAIILVILTVVAFRRWPASYGAYAAITLLVALSAPNLDSLERYGLGCFPFILGLASLTGSVRVRWVVLSVSALAMFALGTLAFLGSYVP
ncbi:MAG: mannosyltransferase family protein [Acidimicrobiales bacterium]